jgi:GDP-L-fucose synthase
MSLKVLITGGTGLVGSAINSIREDYSNYKFIFMSSKDCDLTDYNASYNYFTNIKPDYVIHLAACVGGLFKNMNNKIDMFEKNMLINMNVLKICHIIKVKKLISCLSTCIFPDNTTYPINEKMLHNGPPHTSNDGYAYAKRMLEVQTRIYQEQFNDNFICIIPTNIYGPNDNYNLIDGHVIPSLIHKCYLAKKEGKPFVIAGTGKPLRQFVYSIDLAHLIIWVLEKYNNKESIILSVGEDSEVSINTIATEIAKEFSYTHNIIFDNSKPDGQYKKTADNTILMSLNSDFKFTSISDGIKKSVAWFIENYDLPTRNLNDSRHISVNIRL